MFFNATSLSNILWWLARKITTGGIWQVGGKTFFASHFTQAVTAPFLFERRLEEGMEGEERKDD
jgi:hypothetical protein